MKALRTVLALGFICLLIGCTSNQNTTENKQNVNFNMVSTNSPIDQTASNQAKESLSQRNGVTAVTAVNTEKKLILAFEIEHHKRFRLADIQKDVQKKMDNEFPNLKVDVSADKKLVLDIEKLEEKISKNDISKKKLKKEVDRLIKLMKDKT
ncbi:YhcN/YlaJ family sporulation lipoprotein [Lentibacillus salinarum]|uniref:YhcN/YlaJ family sporulation lipoprotein n=1 Tax=Lentibacillus salinarum TaxID=446820 RepID=A0ABW3ZTJ4_9BACI